MPTPLTPQTEAARILARIGDEVRDQYGNQITAAINQVMLHQLKELTYKEFKEIAKTVIDENLPGWQQVMSYHSFMKKKKKRKTQELKHLIHFYPLYKDKKFKYMYLFNYP